MEAMQELKDVAYKYWCTNDIKDVYSRTYEELEEYNDEPVEWCSECMSLAVMGCENSVNNIKCYCGKCYGTNIAKGHINEWQKTKQDREFNQTKK